MVVFTSFASLHVAANEGGDGDDVIEIGLFECLTLPVLRVLFTLFAATRSFCYL